MNAGTGNGDSMSWRALIIGAAIAVAIGATASYLLQEPSAVAILRGGGVTGPTIIGPNEGAYAAREIVFEWKSSGPAHLKVIDLSDSDKVVIDRAVDDGRYEPTGDERRALLPGHEFHWFVEVQAADGRTIASPAARFTIR